MKKYLLALLALSTIACTQNYKAKNLGGSATLTLAPNRKLVNVTWKDENLWYLTRPMLVSEQADTLMFKEKSNFGNLEGTYIIIEVKK